MRNQVFGASLGLVLAASWQPAYGDDPLVYKDFKDCLALEDIEVRVTCYDTFAKGEIFTPKAAEKFRRETFGLAEKVERQSPEKSDKVLSKKQKRAAAQAAETKNTLLVTVVDVKNIGPGDVVIVTHDGAVWRQRGRGKLTYKKTPFEATIKKGRLGSYMISPTFNRSSMKVKRVK